MAINEGKRAPEKWSFLEEDFRGARLEANDRHGFAEQVISGGVIAAVEVLLHLHNVGAVVLDGRLLRVFQVGEQEIADDCEDDDGKSGGIEQAATEGGALAACFGAGHVSANPALVEDALVDAIVNDQDLLADFFRAGQGPAVKQGAEFTQEIAQRRHAVSHCDNAGQQQELDIGATAGKSDAVRLQPSRRRRMATLGSAEPALSRTHIATTVQAAMPPMRIALSAMDRAW